jgi:hypothetical protein
MRLGELINAQKKCYLNFFNRKFEIRIWFKKIKWVRRVKKIRSKESPVHNPDNSNPRTKALRISQIKNKDSIFYFMYIYRNK